VRRRLAVLSIACWLGAVVAQGAPDPAARPLLLTVDDLPVAAGALHADPAERKRITEGLLAALAKHHVSAVGFVIWGNVAGTADEALLDRWLAAGHELGNHTRGHLDLARTAAEPFIADAEAGRASLQAFLDRSGSAVRFFRFPFLREGDSEAKLETMRAYLERSHQRSVPVTIDDQDWSFEQPWVAARRAGDTAALQRIADEYQITLRGEVLAQTAAGDELLARVAPQVLLLHANEVGAAQWDALLGWLEERGFRFASADEVMADAAIGAQDRRFPGSGWSLWYQMRQQRESGTVRAAVTGLLERQSAAWSRGDLETFCSGYAEDAVFVSPSGLTRGRQAVLERYRKRYSTPADMGTLTLEPVELREAWGEEVTAFGDAVPSRIHAVSMVARWTLHRADGSAPTGLTLLVFQPRGDRWLIVQDASM
jgi:uncharacterized protein (TIGR02246 family)